MGDHKGYYHPSHKAVTSEDAMEYLRDGTFKVNGKAVISDAKLPAKYVMEIKTDDDRVAEARRHRPLRFVKIPDNDMGIDYICGDIHGCMDELHASLTEVNFDYFRDRLFCTGDITDRGASSHRALRLLREPWFYTVRGNHEDLILKAWISKKIEDRYLHKQNGGDWFYQQSNSWQMRYVEEIQKLPMGIQVGQIAIVHADYPFNRWDLSMLQSLWESGLDQHNMVEYGLLWSRETVRSNRDPNCVKDIDYIYCGHTIVDYPVEKGNIRFIDTGAFTDKGYMTLFKMHPPVPSTGATWYAEEKTS